MTIMEKEIRKSRKDRRGVVQLKDKFDSLLDPCIDRMVLHGDTEEVAEFTAKQDKLWKHFCHSYNRNPKHTLHPDSGALLRQIDQYLKDAEKVAEMEKVKAEKAKYDRWLAKTTLQQPNKMWRWKFINRFKRGDYVKEKYAQYNGESHG